MIKGGKSLPNAKQQDFLKKKDYGKAPNYLGQIKNSIERDYNQLQELKIKEEEERKKEQYRIFLKKKSV